VTFGLPFCLVRRQDAPYNKAVCGMSRPTGTHSEQYSVSRYGSSFRLGILRFSPLLLANIYVALNLIHFKNKICNFIYYYTYKLLKSNFCIIIIIIIITIRDELFNSHGTQWNWIISLMKVNCSNSYKYRS
jgi:hypothetical protein